MSFGQNAQSEKAPAEAFVGLLMKHRHAIFAFIAKQLVHPADTEDVFQRTSVVLWSKIGQFDPEGSFFHWACGIAFNEVRNFKRQRGRDRLQFDTELSELLAQESMEESESTRARMNALEACIAKLSSRQQEILRRCYLGTDTISEVAESLGRNRDALYKQLHRLRDKLAACISQQSSEDFAR